MVSGASAAMVRGPTLSRRSRRCQKRRRRRRRAALPRARRRVACAAPEGSAIARRRGLNPSAGASARERTVANPTVL
eukprot:4528354-Prymnesium_polylepis.1